MRRERNTLLTLFAVLVVALSVSGGVAGSEQGASPGWSDELFDDIEELVGEYNAQADDGVGLLEGWFFRDERINLHVRDAEGAHTVYALRLDGNRHVTEIRQERFEKPTVRMRTTKRGVEQILSGDDTETAVRQAVRSGRIRLERVFYLFPGIAIFIGGTDVVIGGGVGVASLAVTKLIGTKPVFSALATIKETLLAALRSLWEGLGGIATLLTVLEKLDVLEKVQQHISHLWTTASERTRDILNRVLSPGETDEEQTE